MPKRAIYIYYYGSHGLEKTFKYAYNVDFYHCKSGKNICYVNARAYWVERLKKLTINTGNNYYMEKAS